MDELNVTPQPTGDGSEGNAENTQPSAQPEGEANKPGTFSLSNEQKNDTAPSVENSLLQPSQPGENTGEEPSVQPAPTPMPTVEEEPVDEMTEEPAEDTSVLNTGDSSEKPKGGIPKWAMIAGGVLLLGIVVVGAMFATDTWPFKGQLSLIGDTSDTREITLAPAADEYCPDGQYLDIAATEQNQLMLLDGGADTSAQQPLRLLNAIPSANAQTRINMLDAADSGTAEMTTIDATDTIMGEMTTIDAADSVTAEMTTLDAADSVTAEMTTMDRGSLDAVDSVTAEMTTMDRGSINAEAIDQVADTLDGGSQDIGTFSAGATEETGTRVNAVTETAPLEVNRSAFDSSRCKPIPPEDCELLDRLMENPDAYFLSPATREDLKDWKNQYCVKPVDEGLTAVQVTPTCGENQEVDAASNQCVCRAGYFELGSAASTDYSRTNTTLDTTDAARTAILDQAGDATLATNDSSQSTLMLLDGNGDTTTGLPINNNLATEDTSGLEINTANRLDTSGLRINTAQQQLICINCEELQSRISVLESRLSSLDTLDITDEQKATQESVLSTEITRLKAKATEEGCETTEITTTTRIPEVTIETRTCDELVQEITRIQGYPTASTTPEIAQELAALTTQAEAQGCDVPERDTCMEISNAITNRISEGDFRGSYDQQINYIDASCIRELDSCDSRLAYATVAREYRAAPLNAADVSYFEQEFVAQRDAYLNDTACVPNKQPRCEQISADMEKGYTFDTSSGQLVSPTTLTTVDSSGSNLLTLDESALDVSLENQTMSREANLLSQNNMVEKIEANLQDRTVLSDREYYDLYCKEYIPPQINQITPVVPYSGNLITQEQEEEVSPPPTPTPEPDVAAPPVEPPTPEEELQAAAPDNSFQAPAAPSPDIVTTDESIITPPAPTTEIVETDFAAPTPPEEPGPVAQEELLPGAPEAVPMPEITETPEITKTGPEAYFLFFALVASQMFYFRRKIYAFIENR